MVKIQLLENPIGEIQAIEGTAVPLNFAISDIKDPSTKKGAFSKSIQIKGDSSARQLFGAIFHINYATGAFNRFKKTPCVLYQDDVPLINGTLRLVNVTRTAHTSPEGIDDVEFEVLVSDNAATLFQNIGDKLLTDNPLTTEDVEKGLTRSANDIDLGFINDLNPYLNFASIIGSSANDVTDGFKYVWCAPSAGVGSNDYTMSDFKPAIYAKVYFDQIFANAGYTYEWNVSSGPTAMDSRTTFEKLLIPYQDAQLPSYIDSITTRVGSTAVFGATHSGSSIQQTNNQFSLTKQIIQELEFFDQLNAYDPTTGIYTCPYDFNDVAAPLEFNHQFEYEIFLRNPNGATAYARYNNGSTVTQTYQPIIQYMNGSALNTQTSLDGIIYNAPTSIAPGATVSIGYNSVSFMNPLIGLTNGNQIRLKFGIVAITTSVGVPGQVSWVNNAGTGALSVELELRITNIKTTIQPNANYLPNSFPIDMNAYIPKKVKQKDIVKGLLTMFNLYAYPDPLNETNIIIKSRDDFYDEGASKNWTQKWMIDMPSTISFLSDSSNRDITLTYKEGSDLNNKNYKALTSEVYGQLIYRLLDEELKGETKIELPFEPSPFYKSDFNAFVNAYSGNEKIGTRILFDGGARTCDPYHIITSTNNSGPLTTYNFTGHFSDPIDPILDINFGPCDAYLGLNLISFNMTNNNLFSNYWRRSISQIDTGKKLTAYFDLTSADINKLRLSDKIFIQDAWYNVVSVKDYDANSKKPTQVELVTIDDDTLLPRIPIKVSHIVNPDSQFYDWTSIQQTGSNLVSTLDKGLILGYYNIVQREGRNSIISGNGNRIAGPNNQIIGNDNTVRGANNLVIGNGKLIDQETNNSVSADRFLLKSEIVGGVFDTKYNWQPNEINELTVELGNLNLNGLGVYGITLPYTGFPQIGNDVVKFDNGFLDASTRIIELTGVIFMDSTATTGPVEPRTYFIDSNPGAATLSMVNDATYDPGVVVLTIDPTGPFDSDTRFGGTASNRGYVTIKYINA